LGPYRLSPSAHAHANWKTGWVSGDPGSVCLGKNTIWKSNEIDELFFLFLRVVQNVKQFGFLLAIVWDLPM
jgi:hypothetical protein